MTDQPSSLTAPASGRLDKVLATLAPMLSRARLQNLIREGAVQVNGVAITTASHKLKGGESIIMQVPEAVDGIALPENIPLDIVYEDEHLLVINKEAGMVVHPAAGNESGTLVNALLHHCGDSLSGINGVKRPGIVHRLDKDTSGLIVVAKTDAAHNGLAAQFQDASAGGETAKTLSRRYEAVVWGVPQQTSGTIDAVIGRSPGNRMKMAVIEQGRLHQKYIGDDIDELMEQEMPKSRHGKNAVTHYDVQEAFSTLASRVSCVLETGRTHQIRVHLSSIGNSVIGDFTYGRARGHKTHALLEKLSDADRAYVVDFPRQALHAAEISFIHPATGEDMVFDAPIPADMEKLLTILATL